MLDAMMEPDSDWVDLTSGAERVTAAEKTVIMVAMSVVLLIGNPLAGISSDALGRIITMEILTLATSVAAVIWAFGRSKTLLLWALCLTSFSKEGVMYSSGAMLAEWLPVRWRAILLIMTHVAWNVGRIAITVVWFFLLP